MVGSRFSSALGSALPGTAAAAAALVLISAPVAESDAALPAGATPVTCMPHCANAIYPYMEYVRVTAEEATGDPVPPGGPPLAR